MSKTCESTGEMNLKMPLEALCIFTPNEVFLLDILSDVQRNFMQCFLVNRYDYKYGMSILLDMSFNMWLSKEGYPYEMFVFLRRVLLDILVDVHMSFIQFFSCL